MRKREHERGATSAEYAAALLLVAALLSALIAVSFPSVVGGWTRWALCTLFGPAGTCGAGETTVADPDAVAADDETFIPPACLALEESEQAGYEIKVAFLTFGEDYGFVRQEFADGRVRLTMVDSATIGAVKSGDTKIIDLGKLGTDEDAGATVEVGGGLSFGYGDTWTFDSVAEERAMREQLDDYLIQQDQLRRDPGGGMHLWLLLSDGYVDPPKDASVTFAKVGFEAGMEAGAGLRSPAGTKAEGGTRYLDPNIGVRLTGDASYEVIREDDREAGTYSYTYTLTGAASAGLDVTVGSGRFDGGARARSRSPATSRRGRSCRSRWCRPAEEASTGRSGCAPRCRTAR